MMGGNVLLMHWLAISAVASAKDGRPLHAFICLLAVVWLVFLTETKHARRNEAYHVKVSLRDGHIHRANPWSY